MHRFFLLSLFASISVAAADPAPIVGGAPVGEGEWPDVVGVIGVGARCTGTLIAPDVVLTAGHCIDIDPQYVVTHALDLAPGAPGEKVRVKWARAYPSWETKLDVGVLMLEHVARPTPRAIATACFANQQLRAARTLTVVGYGLATADASDSNSVLRAATMPVIDAFCTDAPGCNVGARPNGEIAAGGRGIDSCFGDSGGPAYLESSAGAALIGVVSRGLDIPGEPCSNGGIYTRADKVVTWIEHITGRELERVDCERPTDDPSMGEADAEAAPLDAADGGGGCTVAGGAGSGLALSAFVLGIAVRRRRR